MTELEGWESFYVIVGSSAGALIGLQFVVMTLLAEMPVHKADAKAGAAFSTPSVVHFGAVLLMSAILSAPWHGISGAAVLSGLIGVTGMIYSANVARRMRAQAAYSPVLEDWMFHVALPVGAYCVLAAGAYGTIGSVHVAMFLIGAAALLLLFIGIHNAWDTVVYNVFVQRRQRSNEERAQ
jgi:hypothetical protein